MLLQHCVVLVLPAAAVIAGSGRCSRCSGNHELLGRLLVLEAAVRRTAVLHERLLFIVRLRRAVAGMARLRAGGPGSSRGCMRLGLLGIGRRLFLVRLVLRRYRRHGRRSIKGALMRKELGVVLLRVHGAARRPLAALAAARGRLQRRGQSEGEVEDRSARLHSRLDSKPVLACGGAERSVCETASCEA
jgi:hypothetical protein